METAVIIQNIMGHTPRKALLSKHKFIQAIDNVNSRVLYWHKAKGRIVTMYKVNWKLPSTSMYLIKPHFCASPSQEMDFHSTSYNMVFLFSSRRWGQRWIFVVLILVKLLKIIVSAFFSYVYTTEHEGKQIASVGIG